MGHSHGSSDMVGPGPRTGATFLTKFKRHPSAHSNVKVAKGASRLPQDWYLRNATAQMQGEFWFRTLLGR